MSKVFTLNGQIINIGEWDYCITTDDEGSELVSNPLPDGAIEEDVEYVHDAKGRVRHPEDYYSLRKAEYPPIGEQLDALFAAGAFPEEMSAKLQAIKDKYPKPE
jgi:hypothetical protein